MTTQPAAPPDDLADFSGFVGRHRDRLVRLAHRRLGDEGDAEEVAQETLMRAYQQRDRFPTEQDAAHWMAAVAGNLVIDRARGRARLVPVADLTAHARTARDTAEVVIARDEARMALDVLGGMPTRQAAIVWAREMEGQSYDEIADRFGMTEPAVRSLLHRGRVALRRGFDRRRDGTALGLPLLGALGHACRGARRTAHNAVRSGPAALTTAALVGLAVVGIGLAPWEQQRPRSEALTQPAGPGGAPATDAAARTPRQAKSKPVRRTPGSVRPSPPPQRRTTRPLLPVPSACAPPAGGLHPCVESRPHSEADTLWVDLPDNPTGKRAVGVDLQGVGGCAALPDLPAAKCGSESSEQPSTGGLP